LSEQLPEETFQIIGLTGLLGTISTEEFEKEILDKLMRLKLLKRIGHRQGHHVYMLDERVNNAINQMMKLEKHESQNTWEDLVRNGARTD
jgi:hypothetical protein